MKLLMNVLFLLAHGVGAWYFASGRLALSLSIIVGSWVIYALVGALLPRSGSEAANGSSELPNQSNDEPVDEVFTPASSTAQQSTAFPDIAEEDAAPADYQQSTPTRQAAVIPSKEIPDPQKCLF